MKRREFVTSVLAAGMVTPAAAQNAAHPPLNGPLASATVSFGGWPATFDRLNPPPPRPPNLHALVPYSVRIRAGGTVNFIIAGFHQIVVYGGGTTLEDISTANRIVLPAPFPPLIDHAAGRVFRGLNPFNLPQDRVEVVHFPQVGDYLVICAVLPHFREGMHGWVSVLD